MDGLAVLKPLFTSCPIKLKLNQALPEREQQIAHVLEFSDLLDLNQVVFATSSQKCNLSFPEYEKIFCASTRSNPRWRKLSD